MYIYIYIEREREHLLRLDLKGRGLRKGECFPAALDTDIHNVYTYVYVYTCVYIYIYVNCYVQGRQDNK